jgi:hypothetical protein
VIDAAPSPTTRAKIARLASLHDEEGVVSIYVDIDPGARHEPSPGDIALRVGLAALRERLEASGDRRPLALLERRLQENAAGLAALGDPSRPGRGRGRGRTLFIPLSGAAPHEAATAGRVAEQVVLEATAYLMPLLLALQESAPVGVVAVSGDGARVVEVRGAGAEESLRLAFDDQSADWRRLQGPPGGTPANQRQASSQADLFAGPSATRCMRPRVVGPHVKESPRPRGRGFMSAARRAIAGPFPGSMGDSLPACGAPIRDGSPALGGGGSGTTGRALARSRGQPQLRGSPARGRIAGHGGPPRAGA